MLHSLCSQNNPRRYNTCNALACLPLNEFGRLFAVFQIPEYTGQPTELQEMKPVWFETADIPYHQMWADDIHWYPLLLNGHRFQGVFGFRNTHELVWHKVQTVTQLGVPALPLLDLAVCPNNTS